MQHAARSETGLKTKGATADYIRQPWRIYTLVYQSKFLKIEVLVFMYMFTRLLYLPLYEQYYFHRFGLQLLQNTSFAFPNGSTSVCLDSSIIDDYVGKDGYKIVEKNSNTLVLYGQIANRLPAMIVVLIMGPLSDRFGRKPVLIASLIGATLQAMTAVVIINFTLSPYFFVLSNFLTGIFSGFTGALAGSLSYVADISSRKWRTFRIGMIEGMLTVGGGLGQFLSGYWLNMNQCNFVPPMWLELVCCLAGLLWVIFLIPESLSKEERMEKVAKKPKGLKTLMEGIKIFAGRMPQYSTWKLWATLLMTMLPLSNTEGGALVTLYFLKAPPFNLSPIAIGAFQSFQSLSRAVSVTILLAIFSVGLKIPDALSGLIGLLFQLAASLLMGFARTSTQVFASECMPSMLLNVIYIYIYIPFLFVYDEICYGVLFSVAVVQGVEAISWTSGRSLLSKLVLLEDQGSIIICILY